MKKFILTTFFSTYIVLAVLAQTSSDTLTPRAGEKQVTFGVTNNSSYIVFKKHKSEKTACRLGFSGFYAVQKNPDYSVNYLNSPLKTSIISLGVFGGFQRRIGSFKKLEPYTGMDFQLTGSRSFSYSKSFSLFDSSTTESSTWSGFDIGVFAIPFIGFNYYLTDRLAIGAEYRMSILQFIRNSGSKLEQIRTDKDGNVTTVGYKPEKSGYTLGGNFNGSAVITATLFLHKQK